jgi:lysophospholipase L1-like esterase
MHSSSSYALMLALVVAVAGCSGNESSSSNTSGGTGGTSTTSSLPGGASNSGGAATGGSLANATGGIGGVGVSGGTASTGGSAALGGATATGGAKATGGATSTGGGFSTGGNASTGGTATTGGRTGTGGSLAAGGTTSAGGSPTGGVSSTGGSANTGGKSGTGGSGATGGVVSTGGSSAATGGRTSTGGSSAATGGRTSTGGSTGTAGSSAYKPCPTDGTACKIMPFGDSITDGYNGDTQGGYRVELFRLAHSNGKNITFVGSGSNGPATVDGVAFPHNHEGHSGWTIAPAGGRSGISTLVATVMPQYTPHIVLLMIGTNDCIDNYDMVNAPTRLGALIDSIYAQLPNVLIVVAQPIPSRGNAAQGDDTALSARIKTFDDAIPAVVTARANAGKHILIVDMYTPFNPNKATLLEDQWHPNLAGYVLLGTQWYSVLQSLI